MDELRRKRVGRVRRKHRVRRGVFGTTQKPRFTVFRSLKHIYAQIIDDERGVTLCSASTRSRDSRGSVAYGGNVAAAKVVGAVLGQKAIEIGVMSVCFDRNGYRFHGRVKALADAAREAGLKF